MLRVEVAGEAYHEEAAELAQAAALAGEPLAAVVQPDLRNRHDPNAVAVHLLGEHVGFLYADVAARVQPALLRVAADRAGRIGCPATVEERGYGPQVVLWLDPQPLGLTAEAFDHLPALAAAVRAHLPKVPAAAPLLTGRDERARVDLATALRTLEEVDEDRNRSPDARHRLERRFHDVAVRLDAAGDAQASVAWLAVARCARYQRGQVADTLAALFESIRRAPGDSGAWLELVDYCSFEPHPPTLLAIVAAASPPARAGVLPALLMICDGRDRYGRLEGEPGAEMRRELSALVERLGDRGSLAVLYADAGNRAAKDGDDGSAYGWWQRAVDAGSTDPRIVDKVTTRQVKQGAYAAAAAALRQTLAVAAQPSPTRERLVKRLARCERELAKG
jgi:hypothetical protein